MSDKRYTDEELTAAILAERDRCAVIADQQCVGDHALWKNETDWRTPWAFNRVVRASMDVAANIRMQPNVRIKPNS